MNDPANKTDSVDDGLQLARDIARMLDEKKGQDLLLLDLRKINPYFCFFLIATANSQMQLKSLVRDVMKNFGDRLPSRDQLRPTDIESGWVVLDFIDVVVHLFQDETRAYYNLERLWGDAPQISIR